MNGNNVKKRLRNSLWGLFIGDALAMPVHWYYNRDLQEEIDGFVEAAE